MPLRGLVLTARRGADWMGVEVLAAILPVLGLRILFDAALTVPGSLVARRMQFRYTALRSLLANAVAAGLCVWLVLEGFALWALVLSQIANSLRGDGGVLHGGTLAARARRVGHRLKDLRVLRPLRHGQPHPQPGPARSVRARGRSRPRDAGSLLFRGSGCS
jgi:O-antigen/teichoic acid export membrane protein